MMRHFYWLFLILMMGTGCSEEPQNTSSTLSPKGTNTLRTALIIGNASYPNESLFSPLTNPINDANEMAKVLKNYGFAVTVLTNGTKQEMDRTVKSFVRKISRNSTVLFYYSGHGVSVQGQNYLIPVSYHFSDAEDVRYHAISAHWILSKMEASGAGVKIMILDACRERLANESKGVLTGGFGEMGGQADGEIISYATAKGKIAWGDTANPHSIYTGALLKVMRNGGHLLIEQVFKATASQVKTLTEGEQIPWTHSSITGDFCFGQCRQTNVANNVANTENEKIRPEAAEVIPGCEISIDTGSDIVTECENKETLKFSYNPKTDDVSFPAPGKYCYMTIAFNDYLSASDAIQDLNKEFIHLASKYYYAGGTRAAHYTIIKPGTLIDDIYITAYVKNAKIDRVIRKRWVSEDEQWNIKVGFNATVKRSALEKQIEELFYRFQVLTEEQDKLRKLLSGEIGEHQEDVAVARLQEKIQQLEQQFQRAR
jgi:hypothetical protein